MVQRYLSIAVVSFVLNFIWESLHIRLYTGYEALGSGIQLTLWATAGDVMYTLIAVALIGLYSKNFNWVRDPSHANLYTSAFLGLLCAASVEWKALFLHRWEYTSAMPIVPLLGVGLSPLLQLTILMPLSVAIVYFLNSRFSNN